MSWHRCRSQLNKKKKAKKMDYYAKEPKQLLPAPLFHKEAEIDFAELRRKLKPFHFTFEAEDYVLPNGDAICDDINCTAFYELMASVPVVHIVDVRYEDLLETKEFGELLSVAYEKIAQKFGTALDINQKL